MKKISKKQLKWVFIIFFVLIVMIIISPNDKPKQEINLTPTEKINNIVKNELNGKSNIGGAKLKNIDIKEVDNKFQIEISLNANNTLSNDMIIKGINIDTAIIYKELYNNNLNINKVQIIAFCPFLDKYGNEYEKSIYITELNDIKAEKINWDIDNDTLTWQVLPNILDIIYLHPHFK